MGVLTLQIATPFHNVDLPSLHLHSVIGILLKPIWYGKTAN